MQRNRQRRYLEPTVAVFVLALLASLGVHLPVYNVLGGIADYFRRNPPEKSKKPEPSYVEFSDLSAPLTADDLKDEDLVETEITDSVAEKSDAQAKAKVEEKEKEPEAEKKEEEIKAKTPPSPDLSKLAVRQRSRDPKVEPPPDAKFIAKENSRVEEETVARLRSLTRDDPEPLPGKGKAEEAAPPSEEEKGDGGDSSDEADLAQAETGSDRATGSETSSANRASKTAPRAGGKAAPAAGDPAQDVMVSDGAGAFRIRTGKAGRQGRSGRAGQGGKPGPNLALSWSGFESAVGSEQVAQERKEFEERRRRSGRRGGGGFKGDWKKFRAAIENYVPNVRPGNQTVLNTAASPFAEYLSDVHRKIHRHFAGSFLPSIPAVGNDPLANRDLHTKLEIIFNKDGSIHKIGVVKTSGVTLFDHGAYSAVMRGQPYPKAPGSILSGDGRVYVHWGFYRNERQCGTFNAHPYILPNPGGRSKGKDLQFRDKPQS